MENKANSSINILAKNFSEGFLSNTTVSEKISDEQLLKEILQYCDRATRSGFWGVIDKKSNLLSQARNFVKSKEDELACLMYATFFEHTINWLIVVGCARKGLNKQKDTKSILRNIGFEAKCTWLLKLLDFKALNENYLKRMFRVNEFRNCFVHYKYREYDFDTDNYEDEMNNLSSMISDIDKTAIYLDRFVSKQVYGNKKERVKNILLAHMEKIEHQQRNFKDK